MQNFFFCDIIIVLYSALYKEVKMGYFLRKDNKKKGTYLQMYETYWDKDRKQPRSKCVKSFGYVDELKSDAIPDPIGYYKELVAEEEKKRLAALADSTRPRIGDEVAEKNIGYFILKSLIERLDVKEVMDILASVRQFHFSTYDMLTQLIYSRVIEPCSKSKTAGSVFPLLFEHSDISEDQINDGLNFVGGSYEKYIELFNHQYEELFPRKFDKCYFDCTNYYFEIDLPKEDKQKGPSKENRHDPIIGQALLLDADLVPLSMRMYPGNESEKPYLRSVIEEMKNRCNVSGKTVQVADKGLNCARNIYAAVKEANDGYIFSKSIHGKNLSKQEKEWILLEDNLANRYTDHCDQDGKLKYRIKSCVDTFTYAFKETDPDSGDVRNVTFSVKEKRIVSYNPTLAHKQKEEIMRQVRKASEYATAKEVSREELGDSVKYISIKNVDKNGKKTNPVISINNDKVQEDLKLAGYNLIVTSELNMTPQEVYETYHGLWKIEESFRITKSFLDARPVFVQKRETIYGHFLVCYLALFLLRVLEIKCFKNSVSSYDIINFIRDFRVVKKDENTFINLSKNRIVNEKMKKATGLTCLDALYLTQKEVDNILNFSL